MRVEGAAEPLTPLEGIWCCLKVHRAMDGFEQRCALRAASALPPQSAVLLGISINGQNLGQPGPCCPQVKL